jgi:Co/Zn/Cd efflux system component
MVMQPSQRLLLAAICGSIYTLALLWASGITDLNLVVGNLAHMAIHMTGLILALVVDLLARRVPHKHNKVKAYGAILNSAVLTAIAGVALWQIAQGVYHNHDLAQLLRPEVVETQHQQRPHFAPHLQELHEAPEPGLVLTYVALLGLVMHLVSFWVLRQGRQVCVNVRGAYVHLRFDIALTALTALTGYLMHTYSLAWLDAALGPVIALLVIYSLFEVGRHAYASVTSAESHHHH